MTIQGILAFYFPFFIRKKENTKLENSIIHWNFKIDRNITELKKILDENKIDKLHDEVSKLVYKNPLGIEEIYKKMLLLEKNILKEEYKYEYEYNKFNLTIVSIGLITINFFSNIIIFQFPKYCFHIFRIIIF